jgi:RNA polymerase sigma-70 factor (ECF subfamily)
MISDLRKLVNQCLGGDQQAMFDLVERFKGQVFGLCYRMLGQRQDAEDVAQETFVRVLKNLHRWDQGRDFEPWLLAIAGNRCRTALASRQRRPTAQLIPDPATDDSMQAQQADQLAEEIQLALSTIRPEYRHAFVLFHEQELSYEQIAESLSRPLGTIKTWIHRARLELIEFLAARDVIQEASHAVR